MLNVVILSVVAPFVKPLVKMTLGYYKHCSEKSVFLIGPLYDKTVSLEELGPLYTR
jgi:hypothetical protein